MTQRISSTKELATGVGKRRREVRRAVQNDANVGALPRRFTPTPKGSIETTQPGTGEQQMVEILPGAATADTQRRGGTAPGVQQDASPSVAIPSDPKEDLDLARRVDSRHAPRRRQRAPQPPSVRPDESTTS